jgi:4-amino-4-deoxy-L-arabinose transferase-like glycosyltransferase
MAEGKFGNRVLDVILIVSACFALYFWDLGQAPFFDKQEPREALVVWEINHSGNWILPLRNGNEIPAKPSLYHWLAALVSQSAGRIEEFTIRLPSAFLGTAGVLLIYFAEYQLLANCFINRETGVCGE